MKASDLFVRALEAEGVEYVFGIPGEENLDMLESLRGSKIQLILTRHEQAAGFMAATYGRLTGKSGVCLATLGPGATNLVTAAAYAQLGGMPMVMITGQKPIKSSKQGQFQIINIVDMMRPLTKYTKTIVGGDYVPAYVREAFRLSEEERPGATHLEFPEDIAREHSAMPVLDISYQRRPIAEEKAIRKAAEAIASSRKPLLLIGAGANRKLTSKMLRKFVEKLGIPAITTQMGKGVIDESGPHFIGNTALSDGDFIHRTIEQADLIINVGHDVVEKPPFFMRPGGPEVVHINFNAAQVDPVYFPQIEVIGDIANSLWQLQEHLEPQEHWSFSDAHRIRAALQKHIEEGSSADTFPIRPQRLVRDVREVMPEKGVIALDNGMFKIWFARNYPAYFPNTVLLDNALATMGAGLPSAMAAKLVCPDRRVVAICGDGGFMMNSQEIETAVRLKLDLIVLILRDDAYGMIKWKQSMMGLKNFGLDFTNPDFVAYAKSYGAEGHRIQATDELKPMIEKCCREGGVHLIEVPMDYSHNDRILNHEIKDLASKL
ncbi:acetolactate synthase large subunit [Microbulbifer variabilis]|jgi:acetolactate synthase-1/2/3 large subunit|uniref:Acetolactate synthase large subunit n=1 Tax=Microbulbifer variabilis TaxID=266805 RepID=A0ABY4V5U1_9GAMM|nr:acetolactate synthase large subunit [Microbulbifer variabilis]USD19651.1 acetolactate synthase large subunit [Microbulbifer variabilis]